MARTEEILDCLQLINSENVGPVTFYKLLELYHSAAEALQALPKHKKLKPFSRREAELELKRAEDKGITFCFIKIRTIRTTFGKWKTRLRFCMPRATFRC